MGSLSGSSTFSLPLCLFVMILGTHFATVTGLKCHQNVDVGTTECTTDSPFESCEVYLQNGMVFQSCGGSPRFLCTGTLTVTPGSTILYTMCCTSDFCNSKQMFKSLLAAMNSTSSSPPVQTTTMAMSPSTTTFVSTTPTSSKTTTSVSTPCSTCTTVVEGTTTVSTVLQPTTTITQIDPVLQPTTAITQIDPVPKGGSSSNRPPDYAIAVIPILAFALVIFIVIIFVVAFLHFYPRHVIGAAPAESDGTPTCTLSTECGDIDDNIFKHAFEGTTSGSGAGHPLLVQRSIAAQVTLREIIGKGRFGEVRKGSYKGDSVAVKIFHTKEEASWLHEVEIYQTCLIRHPNILRFIAADNKDGGMSMELWLISEFCDNGSLYDVLVNTSLDKKTVLKLCYTSASGLAHLHSEIIGTEGKPAIAHRDIKSRNILVKSDFTCCLADLGLALRYYRDSDKVEEPPTKRVGTRRYLSPEILSDTMNVGNFDSFKRSDMYSFGLVMWEIARRGQCAGSCEDYQLPYFDLVNPDPTFEDMKRVVAVEAKRPCFPNRWSQSEVFHSLSQIIQQCWHSDGEARVTALRVKKNLANLQSLLNEDDKKNDDVV